MRFSRLLPAAIASVAVLFAVAVQASPITVYGNLGSSGTGAITNTNTDLGPALDFFIAQGFTAASPDLNVTSITLGLFGDGSIPTTVGIYADNFGQPAASALFTSAVTNVGVKSLYNFSFTGANLTAGSSYWIIPQTDVSWYTASPVPAGQNSSGYTFTQTQENDGTGWVSAGSNRYSVSVQAVPEPSTYALAGIGMAAAGLMRWRLRQSRR